MWTQFSIRIVISDWEYVVHETHLNYAKTKVQERKQKPMCEGILRT